MRRRRVVGPDALQFQRLHGGGLPLNLFSQSLQQFALLDDHVVQLLDLVFEVGDMGLKVFNPTGRFFGHTVILPAGGREVEASLPLHCH